MRSMKKSQLAFGIKRDRLATRRVKFDNQFLVGFYVMQHALHLLQLSRRVETLQFKKKKIFKFVLFLILKFYNGMGNGKIVAALEKRKKGVLPLVGRHRKIPKEKENRGKKKKEPEK